jgi:hypothetical protein
VPDVRPCGYAVGSVSASVPKGWPVVAATDVEDADDRVAHLAQLLARLPVCNYAVLYWMVHHLALGTSGTRACVGT